MAAIRFAADGEIVDAYRILGGTKWNCSGGATPWGTWLSGEEFRQGYVWECDPTKPGQGVAAQAARSLRARGRGRRPGDRVGVPHRGRRQGSALPLPPDELRRPVVRCARGGQGEPRRHQGLVGRGQHASSRSARADTTAFNRGEGAYFSDGHVYFTTTGDDQVWALNATTDAIEVIYDAAELGDAAPLQGPRLPHGAPDLRRHLRRRGRRRPAAGAAGRRRGATASLRRSSSWSGHGNGETGAPGQDGDVVPSSSWKPESEITGLAFSPDGTRLYMTSQRGTDGVHGMTFEITGPFRR